MLFTGANLLLLFCSLLVRTALRRAIFLNNQWFCDVKGRLRPHMFHLGLIVVAEIIETQAVCLRIDDLLQLMFHFTADRCI